MCILTVYTSNIQLYPRACTREAPTLCFSLDWNSPLHSSIILNLYIWGGTLRKTEHRRTKKHAVRNIALRQNPPEIRVTNGQKLSTKIIYIVLQTSVGLFQISSHNNSFLATPNIENECWTSYETLESFGEMKRMMKFRPCFHTITELWNLFSLVPLGNYFSVLFQAIIDVFSFTKM